MNLNKLAGGCLALFLGVATVLAVAGFLATGAPAASPKPPTVAGACQVAQEHVLATLKAPSSARFGPCGDANVTHNDYIWYVSGYVDAQNGFGAMLRADYRVELDYNLLTADWDLVNVDLFD